LAAFPIDDTFDCVDLSDAGPDRVDTMSPFVGPPALGAERCRTDDGSLVLLTTSRVAGIPPAPGDTLLTQTLARDGRAIWRAVVIEPPIARPVGVPAIAGTDAAPLRVGYGPELRVQTPTPGVRRVRQVLTLEHDNGAVIEGAPTLSDPFTCESSTLPLNVP